MSAMPSLLDLLRVVQDPSIWNAVTHVQGGSFHFSYLTNPSQTWPWTCLLDDSRSYGIGDQCISPHKLKKVKFRGEDTTRTSIS